MIMPECPKCGEQGSLQNMKKKGNTYWYVQHGQGTDGEHCWLGRKKREVEVINRKKGIVTRHIGDKD